jgi:uncharacterized membrane protein YdjX (TVP38/TMEM64 family)
VSTLTKKLAVAAAFLIGFATVSYFFPVFPAIRSLCTEIAGMGPLGALLLAFFLGIGSLFFLPASPFIIAGSAFFGFPLGVLAALAGVAFGAASGFCLSRWFLRKDVVAFFLRHETFRAIDVAIEKEGWKIVILLRLCPIPFGFANYLYGLTGVRFHHYLIATIIGSLPSLLLFCELGVAGKAGLGAIISGRHAHGAGQLALLVISGIATLSAIVLMPIFARKAIAKYARISIPKTPSRVI